MKRLIFISIIMAIVGLQSFAGTITLAYASLSGPANMEDAISDSGSEGTRYGTLMAQAEADGMGVSAYMNTNQILSADAWTDDEDRTWDWDSHYKQGTFVNLNWNYALKIHDESSTSYRLGQVWLKLSY